MSFNVSFGVGNQGRTPPIMPQGAPQPQVIDPRAAYEQQATLADAMLANSQQYQGGGGLGALAMMVNAYGANKMGDKAQGSLSDALRQEGQAAEAALLAEQEREQAALEAGYQDFVRRKQFEQENAAPPELIRQMQAAGIDPSSPEGQRRILEGTGQSGPTVNVNSGPQGPQVGTIPQGFQMSQDQGGNWSMQPIPGGPADIDRQKAENANQSRQETTEVTQGIMRGEIGRALEVLEDNPNLAAGPLSVVGQFLNVGPANRLESPLEGLKPNVAFDRLDQMRQNSPTGGAVGQLSDSEREALSSVFGSLRQTQHPDDLQFNLRRLNDLLVDAQHGSPEQRAALVQSGQITPEMNQQVEALYMRGNQQQQTISDDDLVNKYL